MKKFVSVSIWISIIFFSKLAAQSNMTDISLFLRSDSAKQLTNIESKSGDLFKDLGHHGPAIENEFLGLRAYFSPLVAIDLYSKKNPGLELKKYKWYPSKKDQDAGAGGDYYKVGNTIGFGSIRLWDGEKIQQLNPVDSRSCRVVKEANYSFFEMLSKGIPYKGNKIDVLVRVSVFSGIREAKVEAFALCDQNVQFVTGLNFHNGSEVKSGKNFVSAWGEHPEDINLGRKLVIGSSIIFNANDFEKTINNANEKLFVTFPTKYVSLRITAANDSEKVLNNVNSFQKYINELSNEIEGSN